MIVNTQSASTHRTTELYRHEPFLFETLPKHYPIPLPCNTNRLESGFLIEIIEFLAINSPGSFSLST